jgi:nicotinate-nucleotide pyrophosphorylase (carboxylating)
MPRIPLCLSPRLVRETVRRALREDVGARDETTRRVVPPTARGIGSIRSKHALVLAGLPLAREVFRQVDPSLRFRPLRREGSRVEKGAVVATIRGRASSVLTGERTALNFLQHLSGIATYTARCVALVRGRCQVLDTRKTHPGLRLLEKYAVRTGGAHNHRLRLDDGILIKHNHWRVSGGVAASVRRAKISRGGGRRLKIQVEVSRLSDLREALRAGADAVLLDNLTSREIRRALKVLQRRIPAEVSGGITLTKLARFARLRPAAISLGSLTHSAPWVDLSLRLEKEAR